MLYFLQFLIFTFVQAQEVSVMTYNVENLFDGEKDPGKLDWTYLPKEKKSDPQVILHCKSLNRNYKKECFELDWDTSVINAKMKNLSTPILSVDKGQGPDVLMLIEVENEKTLKKLNREYLKPARYTTEVLIEGSDDRGIDVALLSRLPLSGAPKLHSLREKTRGVLQVPLRLPSGEILHVYVVHFPSQRNPRAWREDMVKKTIQLIQKSDSRHWILGGDLNISHQEEKETHLYKKELSKVGQVAHLLGCQTCRGTHLYRGSWSFLDALIFSPSLEIILPSVRVVELDSKPKRFNAITKQGASDHLPLYSRFKLRVEK